MKPLLLLTLLLGFSVTACTDEKPDSAQTAATAEAQATATYPPYVPATPLPLTTPVPAWAGVPAPLEGLREEIAVIDIDGNNRRHVFYPDGVVYALVWLPDGRLAYSTYTPGALQRSNRDAPTHETKVFIVANDGSSRQVYDGKGYISLSVSPSGLWLAIQENLSIVGVDPRLTFLNLQDDVRHEYPLRLRSPGWSSQEDYFYYTRMSAPDSSELVRVRPGGEPEPLFADLIPEMVRFVSTNADFTRFIFISDDNSRLYLADRASETVSVLADSMMSRPGPWSSDGRYLLYVTDSNVLSLEPPSPRLWLYDAQTGQSTLLLEGTQIRALSWSASGNLLYSTGSRDGKGALYSLNLQTRVSAKIYEVEHISSVLQTRDGRALLVHRNSCWSHCEPFPIDVILLSGKTAQTLTRIFTTQRFIVAADGNTVYWGSSALVRANSDGTWQSLDDVNRSEYRVAALSPDGSQLAFVRSNEGGALGVRIDVTSSDAHWIDVTEIPPARGRVQSQPPPTAYYVPPPPSGCFYTSEAALSPSRRYVALTNICFGLIVVDQSTRDWAVLIKPDWCRHFTDRSVNILRWTDETHLELVATGDLC